ncbi:P-loop containing nucleoside triphosphate hydrolase protein [Leucogyrophana mollusca]|uniref:P-loop containing nucleoside triphosphate hydrolase protein n=1 Tax=Leucogyrophana mollusca TaxID=85980 RepID=A0ACB8B778_9AGAM|nr:P-loop containing nucleoside triphosphate hydrolase protein [Leucogyrophana mollusca]
MTYPSDSYPVARSINRKVIMHVGPTNSGKTHMALRALAAARVGLYAGPLRLLAHEIWDRLNKGQIVPLGMEPDADSEPDTTSSADLPDEGGSRPTVRKEGKSKYARECNLLTGEEFRIVSDNAGLMSCTVEMMTTAQVFDVAVVDEIQMIADPDRGFAWTNAVLGLAAQELHLCGEETAVPIIQSILKETGDELIINRYERLTPLVVQETSLEGDFSQIQKGDCLVTFSRNSIFALKRKVEESTGLRCAVAYGRLPPEIRAEQAALFNDPDSGYDVMVGSDAIGMGLNLKIKRVVFEALHKFDGISERSLSISQIKQIAGRAGRYGLHGEPGGFATTLNADDLPKLHAALSVPADPLPMALLSPVGSWYERVIPALPLDSGLMTMFDVTSFIAKVPQPYRAISPRRLPEITRFIETHVGDLTLEEKMLVVNAPVSWTDPISLDFLAQLCRLHRNQIRVSVYEALRVTPFMRVLTEVEDMMTGDHDSPLTAPSKSLPPLESMHKALVLYLWLSGRNGAAYYQYDEAFSLKERTERALEWSLHRMSWGEEGQDNGHFGLKKGSQEDRIDYRRTKKVDERKDSDRLDAVARARRLEKLA